MRELKIFVCIVLLVAVSGVLCADPPALKKIPTLQPVQDCENGICEAPRVRTIVFSQQDAEPVEVGRRLMFPRLRACFRERCQVMKSRLLKLRNIFKRCNCE